MVNNIHLEKHKKSIKKEKEKRKKNNKKQPNESAIMPHLSEELEEVNIDKKRLTERLKWFVKYKRPENKPRNGVNSYYNISNDSQRTEPPLAPNSLDKPTLDKCPNK